jgi:integrase
MATVKRTDGPRGPRWIVRYHRPDGKTTQKSFPKSGLAHDFATEVEDTKRRGSYVDPARSRITFAQMTDLWREGVGHADTTAESRESDLRLHILPAIGAMPLHQLRPLVLRRLVVHLEAKLGAGSVKRVWSWVVSILGAAVEDGRLARNPAQGVKPKKKKPEPPLILTPDQVRLLVAHLPAHQQACAILAAGAGLRLGEVFGLTPGAVTWLAKEPTIHVKRQLILPVGKAPYLRLPKGGKDRTVPVSKAVVDALAAHMASHPRATVRDQLDGSDAQLIFASPEGLHPQQGRMTTNVRLAVGKAKLPAESHFHSLRHFFASTLIAGGLSEREIGLRLGHSSLAVTAMYGGLFPDADQATRTALDASAAAWMR